MGRALQEDEAIAINVYKPAPTGKKRDEASQRLLFRVDETGRRALSVPEEEIDAEIDKAVNHARHHRE